MATSFVSQSTVANGTRVNTSITAPASIADNDILRIVFVIAAEPGPPQEPVPPFGFSPILHVAADNRFGGTSVGDLHLWVWERRAAGESGDYLIKHDSSITEAYMEVVRGAVRSGSAEDFAATQNTVTGITGTYTANGGTTAVDGSFVTFIVAAWDSQNPVTPPAGTTPTFTERNDPAGGVLYIANGVMTTAGATGNKSATGTAQSSSGGYIASMVSVRSTGNLTLPISGNSASAGLGFINLPNTAIVNFGPFPGKSDATVLVPDSGVASNSLIEAWITPNKTPDHLEDEHTLETIKVLAHSPVAGVGFSITAVNVNEQGEPLTPGGEGRAATSTVGAQSGDGSPRIGGIGTRIWGAWTVSWVRL